MFAGTAAAHLKSRLLAVCKRSCGVRARWRGRAGSLDPRDRSGVWRFREVLPFGDAASIVTLAEGILRSTTLRDAPNIRG